MLGVFKDVFLKLNIHILLEFAGVNIILGTELLGS